MRVGGQRHSPATLPPGKSPGAQPGRVWKRENSRDPNGAQTLGHLETKRTAIPTTLFAIPTVTQGYHKAETCCLINLHSIYIYMCVCVCVCVCEREIDATTGMYHLKV